MSIQGPDLLPGYFYQPITIPGAAAYEASIATTELGVGEAREALVAAIELLSDDFVDAGFSVQWLSGYLTALLHLQHGYESTDDLVDDDADAPDLEHGGI